MKESDIIKALDRIDNRYSFIRRYLFNKANEYAPDIKAVLLHRVCNSLIDVIRLSEPKYFIK